MDGQFKPLQGELAAMGAQLNMVSSDEHVPEVEQHNLTVKEWTQASYSTLPFQWVPR